MRGVVMGCYPNGTLSIEPEDDKVWGYLAERGIPLGIHVSLSQSMPAAHRAKLPGYGRFFDAPNRMIEIIFAGVFDRFPELDVVFAEVDFGWVPYVKEQIDNNYQRLEPVSQFGLQGLPSEYVDRHFHFGYMTDTFGLQQRHYVGAERILWSSDYPHISTDWPNSWRTIQASFSGISPQERRLILAGQRAASLPLRVSRASAPRRGDPAGRGARSIWPPGWWDDTTLAGQVACARRDRPDRGRGDRRRRPVHLRAAGRRRRRVGRRRSPTRGVGRVGRVDPAAQPLRGGRGRRRHPVARGGDQPAAAELPGPRAGQRVRHRCGRWSSSRPASTGASTTGA